MKLQGRFVFGLTAASLASVILATPVSAREEVKINVGDEYATYGYSLDATQKETTKGLLNAEEVLPENEITITPERYAGIFGVNESNIGNIYSSAHVTYGEEGSDITVNIVTPNNITEVSEDDYRNAVITSGMGNQGVTLDIGSQTKVTGEGALAGIFAIQQETGQEVDPEVANLATEELALNSEVESEVASEEGTGKNGETDALTNGLLADIKNEVAKLAQDNNGEISDSDARDIVVNITNNYGLNLSDETIQKLVDFAKTFSQTDISLDPEMQEQLSQLGSSLKEKGGDIWDGIQSTVADPEVQESAGNLWDSFVSFISNLFSSFGGNDHTA